MQLLTHSRMNAFRRCPREHQFRYELGICRDVSSAPLRFGANFHDGLDWLAKGLGMPDVASSICERYAQIPDWCTTEEVIREWLAEGERCVRLLAGYEWRWQNADWDVVASELSFRLPLINPATGYRSTLFSLAGKIDKIVRWNGRLAVCEHKTTSDSISTDSDYWKTLGIDPQISLYMVAAQRLGYDVQTVVYDVVRKPQTRPKRPLKAHVPALVNDRRYYGELIDAEQVNASLETPVMYGARLMDDLYERHDSYYARKEIPRLQSDLDECQNELWHMQKIIRECQRHGRWPRNAQSCLKPFRCEFVDVCFNGINPALGVPEGFVGLEDVHSELGA